MEPHNVQLYWEHLCTEQRQENDAQEENESEIYSRRCSCNTICAALMFPPSFQLNDAGHTHTHTHTHPAPAACSIHSFIHEMLHVHTVMLNTTWLHKAWTHTQTHVATVRPEKTCGRVRSRGREGTKFRCTFTSSSWYNQSKFIS